MTSRVGLIEWMKHTKTLKEFLKDAMDKDEQVKYDSAMAKHKQWLNSKHEGNYRTMYKYVIILYKLYSLFQLN